MVFSKKRKERSFNDLRKSMVELQLKSRGINDSRVLETMAALPREKFVPSDKLDQAYFDSPLPIGQNQTISQPYIVALMTQLLCLGEDEKVLEVGTGSGYQTAILAKLAKQVYSIERHQALLSKAEKVFGKLGLENIETKLGDGSKGWEENAPYQAIIVTAAAAKLPQALIAQLAEGGRLVLPLGSSYWQELVRITKKKDKLVEENFGSCAFVSLVENKN